MSEDKKEVPTQGADACDGCGQPIGHANSIKETYNDITPDVKYQESFYFGQKECKEIFEKHHSVGEFAE